jgi:hypothetical protein
VSDDSANKGGRPAYKPKLQDKKIVKIMSGCGIRQEKICLALDIDEKTLRKYFERELKIGAAQVEAQCAGNMMRLANGKDGTAFRANEFLLTTRFGWSKYAPPPAPAREPELGKKKQLEADAKSGHETSSWGEVLTVN